MTWVRLDEDFDEHPKVAAAGPLGLALQVRAICYCNRNLTDGFISSPIVRRLAFDMDAGHEAMTDLMVQAGLWERAAGGIRVHDYLVYNPSRAQVEAAREQRIEAGRRGGLAKAKQTASEPPSKSLSEKASKRVAKVCPDPVSVSVTGSVSDTDPVPPRAKATAPDGAPALAGGFAEFWNDYPRHIATEKAERAFRAALKRGATLAQMLAAIGRQKAERQSLRDAGEFVPEWPYPASWLNGGRWKDESLNVTASKPAWEPPETRAARGDRSGLAMLFTPPEGSES